LFLVDVLALAGPVDVIRGIDVCLTSTQKCLDCRRGCFRACRLLFGTRKQVKNRGYYFDVIEIDKHHQKNNTPHSTGVVMYAADMQLMRC